MSFADRAFKLVIIPPALTLMGVVAVPYFAFGLHRNDRSGDGSLPFAVGAIAMGVGLAGAVVVGTAAAAAGVPAPLAYVGAYWGTMVFVSQVV